MWPEIGVRVLVLSFLLLLLLGSVEFFRDGVPALVSEGALCVLLFFIYCLRKKKA